LTAHIVVDDRDDVIRRSLVAPDDMVDHVEFM
jgi:hypothetical protein